MVEKMLQIPMLFSKLQFELDLREYCHESHAVSFSSHSFFGARYRHRNAFKSFTISY